MLKALVSTSPRTGVWGLLAALGAFAALTLPEIPGVTETLTAGQITWARIAGGLLTVIGLWGLGHDARDNGKSSESVGAK